MDFVEQCHQIEPRIVEWSTHHDLAVNHEEPIKRWAAPGASMPFTDEVEYHDEIHEALHRDARVDYTKVIFRNGKVY